ncbi:MAG: serine hydrolase [Chitinophagaceae bacterium]|nr:serine hydrolase [Chitinophagaceae bacterium]
MCKTTNRATQTASPGEKELIQIQKQPAPSQPPPGLFPPVQTFVINGVPSQIMTGTFNTVKANAKFKDLRFALLDVTGSAPVYLGHNDTKHTFIASTAKIAVLFAAFWLRKTVRENAKGVNATDKNALFDGLKISWVGAAQKYPGKFSGHAWPPDLHTIFNATKKGNGEWEIDFTSDFDYSEPARGESLLNVADQHGKSLNVINGLGFRDRLELMIGWSDNNAAGSCINALGFQFVNGCMSAAGFFDENSTTIGGLWLSGNYAGTSFENDFKNNNPQKITTQGGNAEVLARFMALLIKRKLADAETSQEMLMVMDRIVADELWDKEYNTSWIRDELEKKGRVITQCFAKVGVFGANFSEAAYLSEDTDAGMLRYAIGCSRAPSKQRLKDLAVALANVVAAGHP